MIEIIFSELNSDLKKYFSVVIDHERPQRTTNHWPSAQSRKQIKILDQTTGSRWLTIWLFRPIIYSGYRIRVIGEPVKGEIVYFKQILPIFLVLLLVYINFIFRWYSSFISLKNNNFKNQIN